MNVSIPDEELVELVEMLTMVAELCRDEAKLVDEALRWFTGTPNTYGVDALREDLVRWADHLAQAMGYPDSVMDPGAVRADYEEAD